MLIVNQKLFQIIELKTKIEEKYTNLPLQVNEDLLFLLKGLIMFTIKKFNKVQIHFHVKNIKH